jgi:hypothetical protein
MDERQLARVRLLSRRFLELQGLRIAFAGGTIAIALGSYLMAAEPTASGVGVALLVAAVLMIPGQWWLHRYYARTFGRQVPEPAARWPANVFLLGFLAVAMYLNNRFPAIPAGGPTMATAVAISLALAIRDWPWRAHYLGVAAVVGMAFTFTVVGAEVINPGLTLGVTLLATGLALVPVGLLDHWLLVRLMADAREAHGARASRG